MYEVSQRAMHQSNVIVFRQRGLSAGTFAGYGRLSVNRTPLPLNRWLRLAAEIVVTVAAAVACGYLILFTR